MKKGNIRIIIGCVLIALQLLSLSGSLKSGFEFNLSFDNFHIFLYDLLFLCTYFFIGIIGFILVLSGFVVWNKSAKNDLAEEKKCENEESWVRDSDKEHLDNSELETETAYKSCNTTVRIVCITMNIIAILLLISSFFLHDGKRNFHEEVAPSIYYIVLFATYLLLTIVMLLPKNKKYSIFKNIFATALLFTTVFITIEGSLFSKVYVKYITNNYGNYVRNLAEYQNANMIFISDITLLIISYVDSATILISSAKILFNKIVGKYYDSLMYREKCYKKVADMQSYLEKGIITREEFEKNKQDILKRIKIKTTNTKNFDEETTNLTEFVDVKDSMPIERDDAFWKKVKIAYSSLYQKNGKVFFRSLAKAGLLKFNEETESFEVNIFDEDGLKKAGIYGVEFDRFLSYVFKSWMQHKIPEIDDNEMIKIIKIISEHFNIDDPYINEISPDSIDRWNDYDKINIDECLYGFYDGSGHKVDLDEKIDEDNRKMLAIYDAMRWIMTDLIYTTSKTSKTSSYDEVVEYLKDNHITWKNSDDKDAALESMKMIDIYCKLSDVYMSVIQTVNWIESNEFEN